MNSLPVEPIATTTGPPALYNRAAQWLETWIGHDLLALAARFGIAGVFWLSGRTKVDGWLSVSENAVALFEDEYKVPVLSPELAAHLAAYAEHLFPVLLALGLATRVSSLALLGMTAVIQVFVYPLAWPTHLVWTAALLYLAGRGAGRFSVDRVAGLR